MTNGGVLLHKQTGWQIQAIPMRADKQDPSQETDHLRDHPNGDKAPRRRGRFESVVEGNATVKRQSPWQAEIQFSGTAN